MWKIKQNRKKIDQTQLDSAVRLFENTSIFKALLRIVFLAVTVSFASGLYVFVDQVLMQRILPLNTEYVANTIKDLDWDANWFTQVEYANYYDAYGTESNVINEITRLVNAGNSPITVICTAVSLLCGLGSAILYSKALGSKEESKIRAIWRNSFYYCFVFSIVSSLIVVGLIYAIIPAEIANTGLGGSNEQVSQFVTNLQNKAREYAIGYSLILVILNIFNNFSIYYVSLLNSEGKNSIPTIVVWVANIINIILDWVLLQYTAIGIYGSAAATIVSYVLSNLIFTVYLVYKNKTQDTFMIYKNLIANGLKVDWLIMWSITKVGIASFFRNGATAVFSIVQLTIYANITTNLTKSSSVPDGLDNTYFTSIMGAVTPIYNLFFSAMIGILRGARTVISYNHGRQLTKNIYKAFWISTGMSFFYGALFFIIAGPLLTSGDYANGGFLWLFNIDPSNEKYWDAVKLLNINTAQLVVYAFLLSGMLYFQSVAKPVSAIVTSVLYGIIFGVPLLYILSAIAVAQNDIGVYQFAPVIISLISGVVIFGYTLWYLYIHKPKVYFER